MNTRKGFTLVELLVVIAILAILATVSVVGYTSFINRADQSNADTEAHQIKTIIESAVIGTDYVKVPLASGVVYASRNGNEVAFTTTEPAETYDVEDLTTDLAGFSAKLSYTEGALVYTYKTGVTSTVFAAPAEDDGE